MRTQTFRRFVAALLSAAVCVVSGCATSPLRLKGEAPVLLEHVPSEDVHISEAHAYEDGDTLVIYGKVKRAAANCCETARGHVDIAAVGPDGLVLDTVSVQYSPRNIPKVRSRASRFAARLPYAVPAGVTLRIAYHDGHNLVNVGDDVFVCRRSAALTDLTVGRSHRGTAGM
ncbi:MAG: hypothetical protein JSW66_16875 [Phycisphaerales bacterium]|nr:MAG: hypothetical protein JSW66_16875 [Phycisphaerales bacterium]